MCAFWRSGKGMEFNMNDKDILKLGIERAMETMEKNYGGPFGAVIIDKNGEIVSIASNTVLKDNDPTAHAEVNAIRKACEKLNTYDLKDYILYTSCEPCPMCLSAAIWANIKTIYYGCTKEDANSIGFRDDIIYDFLKGEKENLVSLENIDRDECIKVFEKYNKESGVIY